MIIPQYYEQAHPISGLVLFLSENIEQETLAPWAAKSSQAVRDSEEAADDLRTAFQRDRDRIIHSTPFRKLKHKTQVSETITTPHHLPFKRLWNRTACMVHNSITNFTGQIQPFPLPPIQFYDTKALFIMFKMSSIRINCPLPCMSKRSDAIVNHTGSTMPKTLEGQVVRRCDRIAYLCHDFDDGCKVGIIGPEKLPGIVAMRLGTENIIKHKIAKLSLNQPQIIIDKYYEEAFEEFRNFMFDYIFCS